MKPPPYVSAVISPSIRLEFIDAEAKASVARVGLHLRRDKFSYRAVHFADGPGDLLANESFADTFDRLNQAGLAFADGSAGWPPAAIMRELQSRRRITESFTVITWRGPRNWITAINDFQPT